MTAQEYALTVEWSAGSLVGTSECNVPADIDPFQLADVFRATDPESQYPAIKRGESWVVICFPGEPPKSSEAKVDPDGYAVDVKLSLIVSPITRRLVPLVGSSREKLLVMCRQLSTIMGRFLDVAVGSCHPVRLDVVIPNSMTPDTVNQLSVVDAVGYLMAQLRRIYPTRVPDLDQLAKELYALFDTGVSEVYKLS